MEESDKQHIEELRILSEQNRKSIERMQSEIQRLKIRLALAEQEPQTADDKAA